MSEAAPGAGLHDALTLLPNRAVLEEHLALALARARYSDRHVALLHVGIDDFQLVNDSLGREAGDAVLREAAQRLRRTLDDTHVVARPGGDEFCAMLADLGADVEQATESVAAQVLAALREPFRVDGRDSSSARRPA